MKKILPDIKVIYVLSQHGTKGAAKAFIKLEAKFPNLRGRKMYGVYFRNKNVYWASSSILKSDNLRRIGLKIGIIPGGLYAYERLKGEFKDIVKLIGPTFAKLVEDNKKNIDSTRPSIEYYERYNKFTLFLPIK